MHIFAVRLAALMCLFSVACLSHADDVILDTSQNRILVAERTVKNGSFIMMVIDNEIQSLPIDQQEKARQSLSQHGIQEAIAKALITSFAENFTASQLIILEPLYGSKDGIEALKKFGKFNSDLTRNMAIESSKLRK